MSRLRWRLQDFRTHNQKKIEEISAFRDDPKIDKIIRALQKQIAQDSYSSSDGVPSADIFSARLCA